MLNNAYFRLRNFKWIFSEFTTFQNGILNIIWRIRMRAFFKFLTIVLSVVFCAKVQAQKNGLKENPDIDNFYWEYKGTSDGEELTLHLRMVEGSLSGNLIDEWGKFILLEGRKSNSSKNWVLKQKSKNDRSENNPKTWKIVFDQNKIIAQRLDKAHILQSIDFKKRDDSHQKIKYASILKEFENVEEEGSYQISLIFPQMLKKHQKAGFFNKQIKKALEFSDNSSLESGVEQLFKKLQNEYAKAMSALDESEDISTQTKDWEYRRDLDIQYNENDYLSLADYSFEFYGGAHGMQSVSFINLDLQQNKLISLSDIISMGTSEIQKLLEKQFRKDFGLKSNESLEKYLFEAKISISENFRFDRTGIYFVYNPYEIAPYALGKIEIFIPYVSFQNSLKEEFRTRMRLKFPEAAQEI